MRYTYLCSILPMILISTAYAAVESSYVVVDEDAVQTYWLPIKPRSGLHYPKTAARQRIEGCIAVGFSIGSTGIPDNVTVLKAFTSSPDNREATKSIEVAAINAVSSWRYLPSLENSEKKSVYTYERISMTVSDDAAASVIAKKHIDSVLQSCRIPDFVSAVARGDFKPASSP